MTNSTTIRCLTLTQPYASLIAEAKAKYIETRSWRTKWRGWIAIHSSRKFPGGARGLVSRQPFADALLQAGYKSAAELPLGCILGVCRIQDVLLTDQVAGVGEPERSFGDFSSGRYAWLLADVRRLEEPIPCKGMLGLWTPPPDAMVKLREAIGA